MPVILCEKHGLTGVKLVCIHTAKSVAGGIRMKTLKVETGDILVPVMFLCEDCFQKWKAVNEESSKEDFLDDQGVACGKCFDELMN